MECTAINFEEKLAKFSDHFSPKIIAKMNDYHFKLAKFQGDYIWHLDNPTNHLLKSHSLLDDDKRSLLMLLCTNELNNRRIVNSG